MWIAVMLVSALIGLALHLLLLGMWQKVATWRVRRHVNEALSRGDVRSLRRAAAETAEAEKEWPGSEMWVLGKVVEITRHRVEHVV